MLTKFSGEVPRAIDKIDKTTKKAKKFNQRATETIIDYMHHCLSILIQHIKIDDSKSPTLLSN